jgi:hypothetical protein
MQTETLPSFGDCGGPTRFSPSALTADFGTGFHGPRKATYAVSHPAGGSLVYARRSERIGGSNGGERDSAYKSICREIYKRI